LKTKSIVLMDEVLAASKSGDPMLGFVVRVE
jgi:hypothetical protein